MNSELIGHIKSAHFPFKSLKASERSIIERDGDIARASIMNFAVFMGILFVWAVKKINAFLVCTYPSRRINMFHTAMWPTTYANH